MKIAVCFFTVLTLVISASGVTLADSEESRGISFGIRTGYYLLPNWSETYDVVYGNSGEIILGIEASFRFSERVEVGLSVERIAGDGERVWPRETGGWDKTGELVSFEILPITLFSRYYFSSFTNLQPFLGLGIGYNSFRETDDETETGVGFLALAGVKWNFNKQFHILLESEYSTYPDIIGNGDLSEYLTETDVGGFSLRLSFRYSI